jgi:hypothetical protein
MNKTQVHMLKTAILLDFTLFVPVASSFAHPWHWQNVNLQGMGYVTGIVTSPVPSSEVYIRTDVGGVYRYDRRNQRWIPLMDQLDMNSIDGNLGVESIAVEPLNSSHVFAAMNYKAASKIDSNGATTFTYSGEILESTNSGTDWKPTGLASCFTFT